MKRDDLVLFACMNASVEHAESLIDDIDVMSSMGVSSDDDSEFMSMLSNFIHNKKRRIINMANSLCEDEPCDCEEETDCCDDDDADSDDVLCDDCCYCPDFDELDCTCSECCNDDSKALGPDALFALLRKLTRIQKDLNEFDRLVGDDNDTCE